MSTIASRTDFKNAKKQVVHFSKGSKTLTNSGQSAMDFLNVAGEPAGGTLGGSSTSAGTVPTDATAGYPTIEDFLSGATGYLTRIKSCLSATPGGSTPSGLKLMLFDRLWLGGAYSFNANTTLSSQPTYASRLPFKSDGVTRDYSGLEMWYGQVTDFSGPQTVTITYTNQAGTTGQSTSRDSMQPANGECRLIPLAAGDSGIQKIESVVGSVASAGTFNIMILRKLWTGYINSFINPSTLVEGAFRTNMIQIFQDSALMILGSMSPTGTINGVKLDIEIASG